MGARQENLRPPRFFAHVINVRAHAIAAMESLARQQFVAPDDGLRAAQIDDHIAEFDALDDAVHDFADAILIFLELALALGLAHALHDDLLGGLRGDAPEVDGRQRLGQKVADLSVGIALLRNGDGDLRRLVFHRIGDLKEAAQFDFAVFAVDGRPDIVFVAVFRAARLLNRELHRFEHFFAVDAFFARDRIGYLNELDPRMSRCRFHLRLTLCVVPHAAIRRS